jgi:hypothetical protein
MWNDFDSDVMKYVPYFCHSHLISRITFGSEPTTPAPVFMTRETTPTPLRPLFSVLTKADRDAAMAMANREQYHREMVFGRSMGMWTINGETWDTAKIAASDVGQNTWEVWKFKTGGGWFHPVHMHLVDFFLLRRDREIIGGIEPVGLRTNEIWMPKDVFYLGPSEEVYVLARFGPHKGDYMFHCHNLIHEDNDMMRAIQIVDASSTTKNPTSSKPFIINRLYGIVYNNWKYADPMLGETAAKPSNQVRTLTASYVNQVLYNNLYRIFYPRPSDIVYMRGARNPWQSQWCPVP